MIQSRPGHTRGTPCPLTVCGHHPTGQRRRGLARNLKARNGRTMVRHMQTPRLFELDHSPQTSHSWAQGWPR